MNLFLPFVSPIRLLLSRGLLKAYIRMALAATTSLTLFVFAVIAYIAFYHTYVPFDQIRTPLYFDYSRNPSSTFAKSSGSLFADQVYLVSIELSIPRTPHNRQMGNFMLELRVYDSDPLAVIAESTDFPVDRLTSLSPHNLALLSSASDTVAGVLHNITLMHSRRPAIITYRSDLLEGLETVFLFPLLVSGITTQSERLNVEMGSWVGSNHKMPQYVAVEIHRDLQVYGAELVWDVRWSGIRWLMRKFYVTTFIIGVLSFWTIELVGALLSWFLVSSLMFPDSLAQDLAGKEQTDKLDNTVGSSSCRKESSVTSVAAEGVLEKFDVGIRQISPSLEGTETELENNEDHILSPLSPTDRGDLALFESSELGSETSTTITSTSASIIADSGKGTGSQFRQESNDENKSEQRRKTYRTDLLT
ncbi:putative adipose-regulatory protein-domain-containing protein [Lipomyces arxii]|uniref:putative adipose-regulatory protein-domain-containing protein n=1 Tax=Lipomyces arxii TaxID=56418 RepID=UPI0034CDEA13